MDISLSHIQKRILSKLLTADTLRYSEMRPEGVEKDLFYYHLTFLKDKGYIEKRENGYTLTSTGKILVTNLDYNGKYNNLFKIGLFLIVEDTNNDGTTKVLMHKRKRQPYYNDILPPTGTVKQGELLDAAIIRKLKEETNLKYSDTYKRLGILRLMFYKNKKMVEDISMHLIYVNDFTGQINEINEYGEFFWSTYKEAMTDQVHNKTKIQTLIHQLEKLKVNDHSFTYLEERIDLDQI